MKSKAAVKQKVKPASVEEYIAAQPLEARAILKKLRQTIKKAAPGAEEVISYSMPAFKLHGILVWYGAHKNHYALYPHADTVEKFKVQLRPYEFSKGTIKIPLDKPVPVKLVTAMVKYRMRKHLEKARLEVLKNK
jgi:uncharacterized protein YdhG (YjbR/CyaY superfamily)